jgi:hypothetical protein
MPCLLEAEALMYAVTIGNGILIEFDWKDAGVALVWTTRDHAIKALAAAKIAKVSQRASWCCPRNLVEGMTAREWFRVVDIRHERRREITDAGRQALARWKAKNMTPKAA